MCIYNTKMSCFFCYLQYICQFRCGYTIRFSIRFFLSIISFCANRNVVEKFEDRLSFYFRPPHPSAFTTKGRNLRVASYLEINTLTNDVRILSYKMDYFQFIYRIKSTGFSGFAFFNLQFSVQYLFDHCFQKSCLGFSMMNRIHTPNVCVR